MLRLFALLLVLSSGASAQTSGLQPLPPFSVPITENFRPPQTSAVRAYAYSAAATGALVGIGYAVYALAPDASDERSGDAMEGIGLSLIALGAGIGPPIGNLSLGNVDAVHRAFRVKATGALAGGAGVLAGTGLVLVCVLAPLADGSCSAPVATGALVLLVGGAGVMAAGIVAGTVVDLATIPASARWAREARTNGNRVRVSPTAGLRRGAPVLGLRARF